MKVINIINQAIDNKDCRFAFELLPPLKGENINSLFSTVDNLARFNPAYINVTYHREDTKYIERTDGLLERRITKKRPGTVAISAALMAKYSIEVVPHIICGGFSKFDTEDALIDLSFLGIDNLLALRGDNLSNEKFFVPSEKGHSNATELVQQVVKMNEGKYVDSEVMESHSTNFCIGVAGYPEKHIESPNADMDIEYLKRKVDAGADYIVTQMFFDNSHYFSFVERCRAMGINVPIIPGIKPLSTKRQLTMLPQIFHVDIPQPLALKVNEAKNNQEVRNLGVEWAIKQCKELKESGVPVIHFYTMGKSDNIEKIASAIF
ncbi:MAG: methylenetetrahydrofolate reductase [NAD(P)H] [Rikenellaceae bacterium]